MKEDILPKIMRNNLELRVIDCLKTNRNSLELNGKKYCLLSKVHCPFQEESDKHLKYCKKKPTWQY